MQYSVDALLVTCTPDMYTRERGGTWVLGVGPSRWAKLSPMVSLPGPCVPQPRAVSSERVFFSFFFFFFVFTCHLQPKQQSRENKLHDGQIHAGHSDPAPAPAGP